MENKNTDRRGAERFLSQFEVRYKGLGGKGESVSGSGRTINMSSHGVLFSCDQILPIGRELELSVSWPVKLDSKTPLQFLARGRVVRFNGEIAAVEIRQHEFRTQSVSGRDIRTR